MIGAIDQGTTSTRFMLFKPSEKDCNLSVFRSQQLSHENFYPHAGWVEQNPLDLLNNTKKCIQQALDSINAEEKVKIIGLTNQRETTIVWDKQSGKPLYNAIVWNDLRTQELVQHYQGHLSQQEQEKIKQRSGLPISTYFSALKLKWLLENVQQVKDAVASKRCMFGTVDSWLIWNLTGGINGGIHVTDVTNASRTMLMNIKSLKWDSELFQLFGIPFEGGIQFPEIKSCAEIYGKLVDFENIPLGGCVGDQQAATIGQKCFSMGEVKNTYGTGCFVLMNTGSEEPTIDAKSKLLTTICYQFPNQKPVYALEGSVAVAGSGVEWLKKNLSIIEKTSEIEDLAKSVQDTAGVFFVPAFSGLFAPYWRSDARGIIVGLTFYSTKAHIARAMLEAVCFQTREVIEEMKKESGVQFTKLKVDGGMSANNLTMQIQSDLLGAPVIRPHNLETTVLGAAYCAAIAIGVFNPPPSSHSTINTSSNVDPSTGNDNDISSNGTTIFTPKIPEVERNERYSRWKLAVEKSLNWNL